jgi:two-component system, cell cycle sensor histidine kinase and response regulator CckA
LEDFSMAKKPTYEELEQKVRELKRKASKSKQEDTRKQAEETLRENEERLNTILDCIQAGIVVIDAETHKIVDANPAAIKIIGDPKEEIIGHVCHKYICPAEKGACPITDLGQQIDHAERVMLTANGEEVPILKTVTPILLGGKECLLCTFIDISDKKNLEAQLIQAQKMEAIGTLAGGIAHDFNNLLMGIQGHASLMLMDVDPAHPHYERLTGIEEQVQKGAELTRHLLDFASNGKYEVNPTDLNSLIKNTSSMFGRTKKEIEIQRKYQKNIYTVDTGRGQIEQVLLNLYVNAWQAMPGGGKLYLQTENVILDEDYVMPYKINPGRYVKVTVTDTGIGMDKETQQRLFEPFFTTKVIGGGSGLGLASTYGIIKNHDGFINVYSKKGEGTTFTFYLPASEQEIMEERDLDGKILEGSETILFVDDEDMIIDVGKQFLAKMGYTVLIARGGKEAIEICEKGKDKIDIVILDMIMPDMGGAETYDTIRKIKPDIKVLLSSGYSIDGHATEILKRGCNGFIQKPFNMKQLSRKLRRLLDAK